MNPTWNIWNPDFWRTRLRVERRRRERAEAEVTRLHYEVRRLAPELLPLLGLPDEVA